MSFVEYKAIKNVKFDESQYLQTGITKLDKKIVGLGLGQLIVITGTRAGGKTTLIGNIIANFIDNGFSGLLCSFEMTNSRLKNWLNLQVLGKDNLTEKTSVTGKQYFVAKNEMVEDKVSKWVDKRLKVYDNSSFNIKKVYQDIITELNANPDIKFIVIDNLMKLETDNLSDNKYEAQSRLVKNLQVFAQKRNICLILVAHPNKIKVLPRIEDVGGSGDIINTADTVLLVHRVTADFIIRAREYFQWEDSNPVFSYSNIIEIAKDREFGDDDSFIGVYFEEKSKRFLNSKDENKHYKWEEQKQITITPMSPEEEAEFNAIF